MAFALAEYFTADVRMGDIALTGGWLRIVGDYPVVTSSQGLSQFETDLKRPQVTFFKRNGLRDNRHKSSLCVEGDGLELGGERLEITVDLTGGCGIGNLPRSKQRLLNLLDTGAKGTELKAEFLP